MNNLSELSHDEYIKLFDDIYTISTHKGHMLRVHNIQMTNEDIGNYYNMKDHKVSSILSSFKIMNKFNNNKKFRNKVLNTIKKYRKPRHSGKVLKCNPNGIRMFIRYKYNNTYCEFRNKLLLEE